MKNNGFIENILRLGQSPFGYRTQLHKHQFNEKTNKNMANGAATLLINQCWYKQRTTMV